jgi:hypothetical protein
VTPRPPRWIASTTCRSATPISPTSLVACTGWDRPTAASARRPSSIRTIRTSGVGNEQNGNAPNEQRLFKPPVDENNEQPTSGKPAVRDPQPMRNIKFERTQPEFTREPLATPPVADESFDNWGDEPRAEASVGDVANSVIPTWLDDDTAETIAEEQAVQENNEPAQASLGMVAIPIIAGELLERRRRQREEAARRKPR